MAVKRTTIELDEDLVQAARAITGENLRATVERALRQLVAEGDESVAARHARIVEHITHASSHVDVDVLLSDQAWR
ncbi:Putative antitoxin VapB17 [Mycobacterium persicum]|uniref:Antitoxin VapB17 n=1 Tax=Mycobacterium persicum TaxID=1487726 RepID=A0ABY6RRY3_9MYCO|nr:type II toxin-antitoxin system VapB family antitoxin [Mycobacterium persicum]VBA31970.1 Putative antitoxin VapB17 [Mycobacterium persicum]